MSKVQRSLNVLLNNYCHKCEAWSTGVFCNLLIEFSPCSCDLHFGRQASPGNVHRCSIFSPFVDNVSHFGSLESQIFRNDFRTFSRLMDLIYFFSHLFLNFFGSQHDDLFDDILVCPPLSANSYWRDFLIESRCGSNQTWVWLVIELKCDECVVNMSLNK